MACHDLCCLPTPPAAPVTVGVSTRAQTSADPEHDRKEPISTVALETDETRRSAPLEQSVGRPASEAFLTASRFPTVAGACPFSHADDRTRHRRGRHRVPSGCAGVRTGAGRKDAVLVLVLGAAAAQRAGHVGAFHDPPDFVEPELCGYCREGCTRWFPLRARTCGAGLSRRRERWSGAEDVASAASGAVDLGSACTRGSGWVMPVAVAADRRSRGASNATCDIAPVHTSTRSPVLACTLPSTSAETRQRNQSQALAVSAI